MNKLTQNCDLFFKQCKNYNKQKKKQKMGVLLQKLNF